MPEGRGPALVLLWFSSRFFCSHLGCKDRIDGPRVGAVQCLPSTCEEALGPTYRTDKNRAERPLN